MIKKYNIHTDKLVIAYKNDEATTNYIISHLNDEVEGNFNEFILLKNNDLQNYRYAYDIVAEGEVLAVIYWGHFNPQMQSIYIKYNNKALYFENKHYITFIEDRLNLKFEKIANVDLAIDFNFNITSKIYRVLRNKNIDIKILNKVYDYNENIPVITTASGARRNLQANKTLSVVSKNKGLGLHSYNKSREIAENGNCKQYITDVNNFTKCWRLEVRCTHKELHRTLTALHMTEDEVYMLALTDGNSTRLFEIYNHLLDRLIMVTVGRKSINLLNYIANE